MRFHQNILILRNKIFQVYDLLGHPGGEKEKGGGPNEVFITRKSEIIFKVTFFSLYSDQNGDISQQNPRNMESGDT